MTCHMFMTLRVITINPVICIEYYVFCMVWFVVDGDDENGQCTHIINISGVLALVLDGIKIRVLE